ncbi:MAG: 2-C-methyl-D-erythritol 2,4-cyclodiphosphate synthase [Syntrophobacterales bacterium]|nr:2-C-methyl-D-erythritol 2,4-cyclodiphosphate synthase [Syntrophobacterales bacterium]
MCDGGSSEKTVRVGIGYDSHRWSPGRRLVLGGVNIPHPQGLVGHSDADALVHAVCDAVLGAVGAGDIGTHFPDTDPTFRDISSLLLLGRVKEMVAVRGYRVVNVDATVIIEQPKLRPYVSGMIKNIAEALALAPEAVSVKAKTNEGMGFVGSGEGIAALAVALVTPVPGDSRNKRGNDTAS